MIVSASLTPVHGSFLFILGTEGNAAPEVEVTVVG